MMAKQLIPDLVKKMFFFFLKKIWKQEHINSNVLFAGLPFISISVDCIHSQSH